MKMNRKAGIFASLVLLVASVALSQEDIGHHRNCSDCGMDRKSYGYSRMLIVFQDGTEVGTCSLHCAVVEIDKAKGKAVKSVLVAERDNRELIDAEKAAWVIGGKKRGVMTAVPKWAFAMKAAAEAFVKSNGGKVVSWDEALDAARKEPR